MRQALWLVRSRAFTTLKKATTLEGTKGLLQRTVLIPFLDLLNHNTAPKANAQLQVVETENYEESFYALTATGSIESGEEITIPYGSGRETSWDMYTKYGFWPCGHELNDMKCIHEVVTSDSIWTTSLARDKEELAALSMDEDDSIRRAILDFRIRMKSLN